MSLMKKYFLFAFIILLSACGGRVPSPQTATDIMKDHFKKYGKKYPTSIFGTHTVSNIEIVNTEELQRKIATTQALLTFNDGNQMRIQMNFQHKPFGWKATGWEDLNATPLAAPQN